jgi:hypothetical protein
MKSVGARSEKGGCWADIIVLVIPLWNTYILLQLTSILYSTETLMQQFLKLVSSQSEKW